MIFTFVENLTLEGNVSLWIYLRWIICQISSSLFTLLKLPENIKQQSAMQQRFIFPFWTCQLLISLINPFHQTQESQLWVNQLDMYLESRITRIFWCLFTKIIELRFQVFGTFRPSSKSLSHLLLPLSHGCGECASRGSADAPFARSALHTHRTGTASGPRAPHAGVGPRHLGE